MLVNKNILKSPTISSEILKRNLSAKQHDDLKNKPSKRSKLKNIGKDLVMIVFSLNGKTDSSKYFCRILYFFLFLAKTLITLSS